MTKLVRSSRSFASRALGSFAAVAVALVAITGFLAIVGCAGEPREVEPDAMVSNVPARIDGTYSLVTRFDLATLPAPAEELLGTLHDATDTPEDPARFIVDRMIAKLPEGSVKNLAVSLAGYVAPYVQLQIDRVAPRFAPGVRQLARGVASLGREFETTETLEIALDGVSTRTLVGLSFGGTPAMFSPGARIGATAMMRADLDLDGSVAMERHALVLPYGEVLALALDRAVVPSLDASASDLFELLRSLVACDELGAIAADKVGIGSASLYAAACDGAMIALASEVYDRIHAIDETPFTLEVSGAAMGVDVDRDGMMDELRGGAWKGNASYESTSGPIGRTTFAGKAM